MTEFYDFIGINDIFFNIPYMEPMGIHGAYGFYNAKLSNVRWPYVDFLEYGYLEG